jgi:hypothetical protein
MSVRQKTRVNGPGARAGKQSGGKSSREQSTSVNPGLPVVPQKPEDLGTQATLWQAQAAWTAKVGIGAPPVTGPEPSPEP